MLAIHRAAKERDRKRAYFREHYAYLFCPEHLEERAEDYAWGWYHGSDKHISMQSAIRSCETCTARMVAYRLLSGE